MSFFTVVLKSGNINNCATLPWAGIIQCCLLLFNRISLFSPWLSAPIPPPMTWTLCKAKLKWAVIKPKWPGRIWIPILVLITLLCFWFILIYSNAQRSSPAAPGVALSGAWNNFPGSQSVTVHGWICKFGTAMHIKVVSIPPVGPLLSV